MQTHVQWITFDGIESSRDSQYHSNLIYCCSFQQDVALISCQRNCFNLNSRHLMLQLYIGTKIYLVSSFPKKKLSIGFEKRQSCFATQKHKYYSNVAILTHSLSFSTARHYSCLHKTWLCCAQTTIPLISLKRFIVIRGLIKDDFLRPYKWFLSPYFKWVPKINISITVLQRRFDSASSFISVAHFYLIVRRKTTTSYVQNTKDLYTGTDLEKANHTTLAWYGCFQRSFNSFSLSDFSLRFLRTSSRRVPLFRLFSKSSNTSVVCTSSGIHS